jgi:hypothetical protein
MHYEGHLCLSLYGFDFRLFCFPQGYPFFLFSFQGTLEANLALNVDRNAEVQESDIEKMSVPVKSDLKPNTGSVPSGRILKRIILK